MFAYETHTKLCLLMTIRIYEIIKMCAFLFAPLYFLSADGVAKIIRTL